MTRKRHDPYPNPTVAEALCEIHFVLPEGKEWESGWFGEFYREIQEDYPKMEPRQGISWEGAVFPGGIKQGFQAGLRMVYKHKERRHLLQLAEGLITVNELAPYPGWGTFMEDIEYAWEKVRKVTGGEWVSRVGLRYINRIPRKNSDEKVSVWLKDSGYYPRFILDQAGKFFSHAECQEGAGGRLIVNLGDAEATGEESCPIIFDIDTIDEGRGAPDWRNVQGRLEALHDRAWDVFSSGITPLLENFLKGGRDA